MQMNARRDPRGRAWVPYSLCWHDEQGKRRSAEVYSTDRSASGIRIRSPQPLTPGTVVFLEARGQPISGNCTVRHCTRQDRVYSIGLEFGREARAAAAKYSGPELNYYEFLQISPSADVPAIQRVYRLLAARFHPDNPETGDVEKFLILQEAHETLCDAGRRAAYDESLRSAEPAISPIFQLSEFVIGLEAEANRRLGILSLLYNRRRVEPQNPTISLFDLETRMGLPREHLEFNVWYLRAKQYIAAGDNAEFALTAAGVDFLESNATRIPMLGKLLQSGPFTATSRSAPPDSDALQLGTGTETESGES